MKNSKLNLSSIVFLLFTVMFFMSVNIMAQQKKDTPNKNVIPKTVTPKTVAPKKIVTAPINKEVTAVKKLTTEDSLKSCCSKIPSRFNAFGQKVDKHDGMVWIPPGNFMMGGDNEQARKDEYPKHGVKVNGFYMDATEVTNAQFSEFVKATGYITTAEKDINWEEIKSQVPPNTPKPPDSILKAASLIFVPTKSEVNLNDYSQWWAWTRGANWKHPSGPNSDIIGKDNFPVTHVSWDDAVAYSKWAGKRLPTEAEWEYAARGGLVNNSYSWGKTFDETGASKCNFWQGNFPYLNLNKDGFMGAAPVKSFAPNGYGLYDVAGNVWEWCADLYNNDYYTQLSKTKLTINPKGPTKSYDPDEPLITKRVMRGGSFLCNDSYCSGYRVSARMKSSPDSGMEHLGFRCVMDKE